MQEDGVPGRTLHHRRVHRVAREVLLALLLLVLLPHAGPDVGIHDIRAGNGFLRVARDRDGRLFPCAREQVVRRLVALRAGDGQLEPQAIRRVDPGIGHVVPVADPRDLLALDGPQMLPDREEVGEDLAGMQEVREPVDDGHVGEPGELLDVRVRERPDHDAVHVPGQYARGVGNRFPAAKLHVARREEERVAAELEGPDLEGDTCPGGGLHEDHREGLSLQRLARVLATAHPLGEIEEREELCAREIRDREEIAMRGQGHRGGVSGNRGRKLAALKRETQRWRLRSL